MDMFLPGFNTDQSSSIVKRGINPPNPPPRPYQQIGHPKFSLLTEMLLRN